MKSSYFLVILLLVTLAALWAVFAPFLTVFVLAMVLGVIFRPLHVFLRRYVKSPGPAALLSMACSATVRRCDICCGVMVLQPTLSFRLPGGPRARRRLAGLRLGSLAGFGHRRILRGPSAGGDSRRPGARVKADIPENNNGHNA